VRLKIDSRLQYLRTFNQPSFREQLADRDVRDIEMNRLNRFGREIQGTITAPLYFPWMPAAFFNS